MKEHYKPDPERYPLLDVLFAVAIGVCLALALVAWWSS
jgi:hypothetical protein